MFTSYKQIEKRYKEHREKCVYNNECAGSRSPWMGCSEEAKDKTVNDIIQGIIRHLELGGADYDVIMKNLKYAERVLKK